MRTFEECGHPQQSDNRGETVITIEPQR